MVHANTTRAGLIAIGARSFGAPAPLVHVRDWAPPGRAADLVLGLTDGVPGRSSRTPDTLPSSSAGCPIRRAAAVPRA